MSANSLFATCTDVIQEHGSEQVNMGKRVVKFNVGGSTTGAQGVALEVMVRTAQEESQVKLSNAIKHKVLGVTGGLALMEYEGWV